MKSHKIISIISLILIICLIQPNTLVTADSKDLFITKNNNILNSIDTSMFLATDIEFENTYNGYINETNTANYYRFTLEESGRITFTATADTDKIFYHFYDSKGEEIWRDEPSCNSTTRIISTNEYIDLIGGTYYFVVERRSNRDGMFTFQINYTTADESFKEINITDSFNNANEILLDTKYNGQIADNDEEDFYKFELDYSGELSLTISANISHLGLYVYDGSGNELWAKNAEWNQTTEQINENKILDLTSGVYYFVVKRWNYISYNTGTYSFSTEFVSANESFEETGNGTNNSFADANEILLNTIYYGQIAENDNKDFYKFTIDVPTKIQFEATAKMGRIYFRIYDNSGKQVWEIDSKCDSTTEEINSIQEIELNAGSYYFVVEWERYNNNKRTGTYSFNLINHIHNYENNITKATITANGAIVEKCYECGAIGNITTIYYPETVKLAVSKCTYNGKVRKPKVTVIGSDGNKISSSNYTVSYSKGRKNVGTYNVKVTFKGNYSGKVTKTFVINPKPTEISKLTSSSKGFSIKWEKQETQVTGYQIQYSTNSKFSDKTTKTITKNSTVTANYTKLSANKKYYVRIRTYKEVNGKKYYSSWSAVKTVTTKK